MVKHFAILSLGVLVAGAFAVFALVNSHVDRVVVAHADGVSDHLAFMISRSDEARDLFETRTYRHVLHGSLGHSVKSAKVAMIVLYDTAGQVIKAKELDHTDAHDHGSSMDLGSTLIVSRVNGALAAYESSDVNLEGLEAILAWENSTPAPARVSSHLPMSGSSGHFVIVERLVKDADNRDLGRVRLVIDVADQRSAYADGLLALASLLTLLGIALFGAPALAYIVQSKYATKSRKDAHYLANHDAMTGLLNRRAFMRCVEPLVQSKRISAVAYIDVDHFKSINDTYGHNVGDGCLKHIADAMRDACRSGDILARFGGDEFVIAFREGAGARVDHTLEMLRVFCSDGLDVDGFSVNASVSIGVTGDDVQNDLETALLHSDTALYFSKSQGRNKVCRYTGEMGATLSQRRRMEDLVRKAVENNLFRLHYQPLVDAKTQDIVGYEALLRLKNSDGVDISPAEFVPLAEDMGLINVIGEWVLKTATRQIMELGSDVSLAVNLSAAQFKSGQLVQQVQDALSASGMPANRLELEITESLLLEDQANIELQIDALKELGVSIAMDDFGTGFSSLSYLWKYGFDRLKIDRSFVQALDHNPERSIELIESIIMLAQRMGMRITAEGIETNAQSELVSNLGCDVLQGFYYGKPGPLALTSDDSHVRSA